MSRFSRSIEVFSLAASATNLWRGIESYGMDPVSHERLPLQSYDTDPLSHERLPLQS